MDPVAYDSIIRPLKTMIRWNQVPVTYKDIVEGRVSAQRIACMKEAANTLYLICGAW